MTEQTEQIPQATINSTATPTLNEQQAILVKRLNEADLNTKCFLKVGGSFDKKTGEFKPKAAFETEWEKHLYSPEDFDKTCYCIICKGKQPHERWGITGGGELVILDSDDQRLYDALNNALSETFEVTSARRKIPAKYLIVRGPQVQNLHLYIPEEEKSVGEVRADNWYVVAPGTTIPYKDLKTGEDKTGTYIITKNIPIARLEYDDFMKAITPFLGSDPTQRVTVQDIENGVSEGERATVLFKEACKFIYAGISPQFTFDALKITAARCKPPFTDEEELKRMIKNATQYKKDNMRIDEAEKQTNQQNGRCSVTAKTQDPTTLQTVKQTFAKWLSFDAETAEGLEVIFACSLDRKIAGDPIWLLVIAPPGGNKTEQLRALTNKQMFYTLDSLTAHTLISGKMEKNKDGELVPVKGILTNLNGKVLIIKDFTTILSKQRDERNEIFSQLRSLYDGYLEFGYGNLDEPIRHDSEIGLIAGVTPAVDQYTRLYNILGERFLKLRLEQNVKESVNRALKNQGLEEPMRKELAEATTQFFKKISEKTIQSPTLTDMHKEKIADIAMATAIIRTPVTFRVWNFQIEDVIPPIVEIPTRLAKQFEKLAQSLTIIRGKNAITTDELLTMRRVARDTCYPNRIKIIQNMKDLKNHTTREIATSAKIPLATCWRELKELEYLNVVSYEKKEETNGYYNNLKHKPEADGWTLTNETVLSLLPPTKEEYIWEKIEECHEKHGITWTTPETINNPAEKEAQNELFHTRTPHVCNVCNNNREEKGEGYIGGGDTIETAQKKPRWFVKPIPAGAKCECGKYAVTFELISPLHEQIIRCEECYRNLQKQFNNAVWKQAEPELEYPLEAVA